MELAEASDSRAESKEVSLVAGSSSSAVGDIAAEAVINKALENTEEAAKAAAAADVKAASFASPEVQSATPVGGSGSMASGFSANFATGMIDRAVGSVMDDAGRARCGRNQQGT